MKKKQIYLHIGTTKTGTSSIQGFLNHNREKLKQYNFTAFTPDASEDLSEAHKLRSIIELMREPAKTGVTHWSDSQRQLLHNSVKCIKEVETDNIILSEELFWNAISSLNKRALFCEFIDELKEFAEIKIIIYLRRQDSFLMSSYQQRLRGGKMIGKSCQEWIASFIALPNVLSNYEENLKYLSSHFSKNNITVRPFETGQFIEQSLIADFMNCVDLKMTDEFETPSRRFNPGLSPTLAEIIRSLSIFHYSRDAIIPFLKSETRKNDKYFNQNQQHNFLSPQERIEIIDRYKSGNQWIARDFLGRQDGILFQEPLPDISEPWEKFRLDPEEVKAFFSEADFLDEKQKALMQKQVLSVLAHPMRVSSKLFLREMHKNIKIKLKTSYLRLKMLAPSTSDRSGENH